MLDDTGPPFFVHGYTDRVCALRGTEKGACVFGGVQFGELLVWRDGHSSLLHVYDTLHRRPQLDGDNWWRGHASAFLRHLKIPETALRKGRVRQVLLKSRCFNL